LADPGVVRQLMNFTNSALRRAVRHHAAFGARHQSYHLRVWRRGLTRIAPDDAMDFAFRIGKLENEFSGSIGIDVIAVPVAIVLSENTNSGTEWIKRPELVLDENLFVQRQDDCVNAHGLA